jgi:internalin A
MGKRKEDQGAEKALNAIELARRDRATALYLRGMALTTVPPEIGSITTLQTLDLSDNLITTLPPEIGSLTELQTLDVHDNQLTTLLPEIGFLTALRHLNLGPNRLTLLPPQIESLVALEILELDENLFTSLPREIGSLTALRTLYLDRNQLSKLPPEIGSLPALAELDLSCNTLASLPPDIGSLAALQVLYLNGNQLTRLRPEIGSLTALRALYLDDNQLATLPPEIGSLTTLHTLDLRNNQLTTLPPDIGLLTALLTLDLRNNQLTTLPPEIASLTALQTLDLRDNQLTTLPPEIASLTALQALDLGGNQLTTLLPEIRGLPRLEHLLLHDNPALGLPPDVLGPDPRKGGADSDQLPKARAILDFYFERQAGPSRPLNEVKIILVGRGGAGKTSISSVLRGEPFRKDEKSTPGISLKDWEMKDCEGGAVMAHLWDFAGQVITHAMHQFFFTTRSVYVLVLTGRENSERADAEYWLRLIRAFGTDAQGNGPPVVVALNKWDLEGCRPRVDRGALMEQHPFIRAFVEMDCKSKKRVETLRQAITKQVEKLEWVREAIPVKWDDVRLELTKKKQSPAYLSFNEFRAVCAKHGVTDESKQESLAEVLHNLGVALNYRNDPRLREATVLKPDWLTKNAYALIRLAEKRAGVLERADADKAMKDVDDPQMRDYLLRLIERFEIAYAGSKKKEESWLVPQALPDEQPAGVEAFAGAAGATRLRFTYAAMPEGIVPRAIVRLNDFIEGDSDQNRMQWASGAVLALEGARALVRANPQDRQVQVTVTGPPDARRRLAGLCQSELRDIHNDIRGLNPAEEMLVEGTWVATKTLEKDEQNRAQTGVATTDRGTVAVDPAPLNNQFTTLMARSADRKPRAFISYSRHNVTQRERLERQLTILKNEGLLADHWHDRMIDPGDKWDEQIQAQLNDADVFLLLVSDAALATPYITEKEIPVALKLHEEEKMVVVPIILKECRWMPVNYGGTKTQLRDLQALPAKGKPVDSWNPRAGAWKSIADGLAEILKMIGPDAKMHGGGV